MLTKERTSERKGTLEMSVVPLQYCVYTIANPRDMHYFLACDVNYRCI